MQAKRFDIIIERPDTTAAGDVLALRTGLSKTRIKQAMIKGAVWLQRPGAKPRRIRRATASVQAGDRWTVYHDPSVLELRPCPARCLGDYGHYSIWFKPAGLMTQGTRFGDHCALSRQVEQHFASKRKVYLVHRIDREASGVLVVAHSREAAARLSALFRMHKVEKRYHICVHGDLAQHAPEGRIDLPLDGKAALTVYKVIRYDREKDQTWAHVHIRSGRFHQIRRHMALIGFPLMGDPRYGRNNKNRAGLQLIACYLSFQCPFGKGRIEASIDPDEAGLT